MSDRNLTEVKAEKGALDSTKADERLGKKLAYLLRYGARKEGLTVTSQGFVRLDELQEVPLLQGFSQEDILGVVSISRSIGGRRRYEKKEENGTILVRAIYRKLERNPYHEDCKVPRLLDQCIDYVCNNIKGFCLEECPDEFITGELLHRLKRKGKLTNAALENLLGPFVENLDLEGALLSQKAPKIIVRQSPHLTDLNLKDCGYLVTDHVLIYLIKNLPKLEKLNLTQCSHLTSASLRLIPKHLPALRKLNLTWVVALTQGDLLTIIQGCPLLAKVVFLGVKVTFTDKTCIRLAEMCAERTLKLIYNKNDVSCD